MHTNYHRSTPSVPEASQHNMRVRACSCTLTSKHKYTRMHIHACMTFTGPEALLSQSSKSSPHAASPPSTSTSDLSVVAASFFFAGAVCLQSCTHARTHTHTHTHTHTTVNRTKKHIDCRDWSSSCAAWVRAPCPTLGLPRQAPSSLCLLYTSPSPRDKRQSRMPSSA